MNFDRVELGQPLSERASQQRPFPGPTDELGEAGDHQRGDRGAALVVPALQDVAPFPPGDIAEPVKLEAVTRSSWLAFQRSCLGHKAIKVRFVHLGPGSMMRTAEAACLGEAITAADPADCPTQGRVAGGREIGLDVELGPQRLF
jgi:hypothetical protein